jgi:hypothetical protein
MTNYEMLMYYSLPHLKGYFGDLIEHDRDALDRFPGTPYLHWTRDLGTHISFLYPTRLLPANGETVPYLFGKANRKHIVEETVCMAEYFTRPTADKTVLVLYYDGAVLKQVSLQDAFNIAYSYKVTILAEWDDAHHVETYRLGDGNIRQVCINTLYNA